MNEEDIFPNLRRLPTLSPEGRALLRRALSEEEISPDDVAFDELNQLGVLVPEPFRLGVFVMAQRSQVEEYLQQSVQRQLTEAVQFSAGIRDFLDDLEGERLRTEKSASRRGSGSLEAVFLDGRDGVHKVLAQVTDAARYEILTMHPGRRPRQLLEQSVPRDRAVLENGIKLRTIYHRTNLSAAPARQWVSSVTAAGAQVRTLDAPIVKTIVVDDEHAFIPDTMGGKPESSGAWHIRDPAVIGYIQQVFELEWRRATPWDITGIPTDGKKSSQPTESVTPAGAGSSTTPRQRSILRAICSGLSYTQVGAQLGVKQRTIAEDMARLRQAQGAATNEQLAFWWANSPDRLLDG